MRKQGIIGAGGGKDVVGDERANSTESVQPRQVSIARLARFGVVGATVMLAFMGLNALFGRWFAPQPAFLLAYGPAVLLHFCVNKWWTFGDRTPVDVRQVREYLMASVITFLIQWPIFTLAHVVVGLPGWLAAGVANGAQMVVSFVLLQWRVFVRGAGAHSPIPPVDEVKATKRPEAIPAGRWPLAIAVVLVCAGVLRIGIAYKGEQFYWPDEMRYGVARAAVGEFRQGEWVQGWSLLLSTADHLLFKVAGLPAAWWEAVNGNNTALVASYYALFSVAALALMAALARAAGANWRESFWATLLAATATSLLYYNRHLLPYDMSLALSLGALWLGLLQGRWWRSCLVGITAALAFLTYNGYWLLGGAACVVHVVRAYPRWPDCLLRAGWAGLGLVLPLLAVIGAAQLLGHDLVASYVEFSRSINQGDFGEGYRVVWEYLWAAERWNVLSWIALIGVGCGLGRSGGRARFWLWSALFAGLYLVLVVFADVLQAFVVYGRTARSLVPFLCLAAAWTIEQGLSRSGWSRAVVGAVVGAMLITSVWQMKLVWQQTFPDEFKEMARLELARLTEGAPPSHVLAARNIDRRPDVLFSEPEGVAVDLLRRPHPLQFSAYCFEGFDRAQRRRIAAADAAMRLVELVDVPITGEPTDGYPGALALRLRFPAQRLHHSEPLITGGRQGVANFFYVVYSSPSTVKFGYDVWGNGAVVSPEIAVNYGEEHEIAFLARGLLPPLDPSRAGAAEHQSEIVLTLNGEVVWSAPDTSNPVPAESIMIGTNLASGSSTSTRFTGPLTAVRRLGPSVESVVPSLSLMGLRMEAEWSGFPGPVELDLHLPQQPRKQEEVILVAGEGATAAMLTIGYQDGGAELAWLQGGVARWRSGFLPVDGRGGLRIAVTAPELWPPRSGSLDREQPGLSWYRLHDALVVNEAVILRPQLRPEAPVGLDGWRSPRPYGPEHRELAGFSGRIDGIRPIDPVALVSAARWGETITARDSTWLGYAGPLWLKIKVPENAGLGGLPLVTTGKPGIGDFVFLRRMEGDRWSVGFDHWGGGGPVSDPQSIAVDGTVELMISHGGLMPPASAPCYAAQPDLLHLRDHLVVVMNGRVVLAQRVASHATAAPELFIGYNPIGGSTAAPLFGGEIMSLELLDPTTIAAALQQGRGAELPQPRR